MATTSAQPGDQGWTGSSPLGLSRHPSDRVVSGVAAGLAARLGVDPVLVRGAFVVLSLAGGAGVVLYLLAWSAASDAASAAPPAHGIRARQEGAARVQPTAQRDVALGLVVIGLLLVFRSIGLWFGDALVWPLVVAASGSAVIWTRSDAQERDRWSRLAGRMPGEPLGSVFGGRAPVARVVAGGLLVAAGMAAFLAANEGYAALGNLALAVGVALVGMTVLLGPWVWRLGHALSDERRERIRSEERAEVAAHLHDSVLQTLALIQRADVSPEVASLARGQERELRAWLFGEQAATGTVRSAIEEVAARVEATHRVPVEVVVVGDAPLDERLQALVSACAEATTNAALHAGAPLVSIYVEVETDAVSAYVRDEGRGFDPGTVAPDRRGIAESIRGRMARHGGTAEIMSRPGDGTEVELTMRREPA